MGHKAWADTKKKRAFLAALVPTYNTVKTIKGSGMTCAKNIPLQKFLVKVRIAYTAKFNTNWAEESLPRIGLDGSEEERLKASRERFCQYFCNHNTQTTSGKRKRPNGKTLLRASRTPTLSISEAIYRLNKEAFDAELAEEFDAHCEAKDIPEEGRKRALLGFRSTFLKRKVDDASDEVKKEARDLVKSTKEQEEENELYQYSWKDTDDIDRDELVRRHNAMEMSEKIAELPQAVHLMEDRVAKDVEGHMFSFLGFMSPQQDGKPSFMSSCSGTDLNGDTFATKHPELWAKLKTAYAAFLANSFKKEDRARVSIPNNIGKDEDNDGAELGLEDHDDARSDQSPDPGDQLHNMAKENNDDQGDPLAVVDPNVDWSDIFGDSELFPQTGVTSHASHVTSPLLDDGVDEKVGSDDNESDDNEMDDFAAELNEQLQCTGHDLRSPSLPPTPSIGGVALELSAIPPSQLATPSRAITQATSAPLDWTPNFSASVNVHESGATGGTTSGPDPLIPNLQPTPFRAMIQAPPAPFDWSATLSTPINLYGSGAGGGATSGYPSLEGLGEPPQLAQAAVNSDFQTHGWDMSQLWWWSQQGQSDPQTHSDTQFQHHGPPIAPEYPTFPTLAPGAAVCQDPRYIYDFPQPPVSSPLNPSMTPVADAMVPALSSKVAAVQPLQNVTNGKKKPEGGRPKPKPKLKLAEDIREDITAITNDELATTAAPAQEVNVVDLPLPKWVKDYQREVRRVLCNGSEKNEAMVNKALQLEKWFKYKPDRKGLNTTLQPAALKWLVERGHDFQISPPVTKLIEGQRKSAKTPAEAFASVFLPYYNALMPPIRRAKGESLGKRIQPITFAPWKSICRCGINGIALLVQGFAWWYQELDPDTETNEADSNKYTAAVEDFIFVLTCLNEGARDGFLTWIDEAESGGAGGC